MQQPANPMPLQVALQETQVQMQLLSSRAQQLAVELFDARQLNQALAEQLAEEQSKCNGLSSKLEELQRDK